VPKRALDILLTLAVAPIAASITGVFALALALELRGWPFFVQERIGLGGKPFRMLKLRTMRHATGDDQSAHHVDDWHTYVFNPGGVRDPRVTRWGQFCRDTSIDELPNLWNVFAGEMSIVGPRPEITELVSQYPPEYHRRHDVRPGITGLAQVNGRSDLTYSEIVTYDLRYVDNHSVLTDLHLLWRTGLVVLAGSGAR
jgi:lipopolysaccharide/colanic/teichoic acid biosynthesis glycosyltransferase